MTKQRLAAVLDRAGLYDLAKLARDGLYDDFESPFAMPCHRLVSDLLSAGHPALAKRARSGEWDGTREEAEAWLRKEGNLLLKL